MPLTRLNAALLSMVVSAEEPMPILKAWVNQLMQYSPAALRFLNHSFNADIGHQWPPVPDGYGLVWMPSPSPTRQGRRLPHSLLPVAEVSTRTSRAFSARSE